jgi:GGDEF domain-containing protein
MMSIRRSTPVDRPRETPNEALDCYIGAIRHIAQYAVDLDDGITKPHREYLNTLAANVAAGAPDKLHESRSVLRGLLRDYRDRAAEYLNRLREELASTARTLEETLSYFAQTDDDHEKRLRATIARLRDLSKSPEGAALAATLAAAADTIEQSLEEIRKQHQLTVSQFHVEIQMLHRRIDTLEAASVESVSFVLPRAEIEQQIQTLGPDSCIILIRVNGIHLAETRFHREVAVQLANHFSKRCRNSVPEESKIGRWSQEEFIVIVPMKKPEAATLAGWITEHLSGSYSCVREGATVRPSLQLNVGVVERGGEAPEVFLAKIRVLLPGK